NQRVEAPELVDEAIQLDAGVSLVQPPLEAIAEGGSERLLCPHGIDQLERGPRATGGEIDGEGVPLLPGGRSGQEGAAQYGRGGAMQHGGSVDVAARIDAGHLRDGL